MANPTSNGNAGQAGAKQHAPATARNSEAILAVLQQELPEWGTVLEVASGSGEHAIYFAHNLSALSWLPSDPNDQALASITAYREDFEGINLREPVTLDASQPATWPIIRADAIVCINMVHICPWAATEGLFKGAEQVLGEMDMPVVLYGPYIEQGVETMASNLRFDASLKSRNPKWGLRDVAAMDELASAHSFARTARIAMPANNLMLVYRRS
ncbi:MAG: DUF938 domain-containing protein [Erythrobacter sp.]